MKRLIRTFATAGSFALLAACSTHGTGTGDVASPAEVGAERGEKPVSFEWASDGASVTSGTMSANVPGHGYFKGQYLQINSETDVNAMGDMYGDYWDPGWDAWDGWGPDAGDAFVSNYSGKLVATLKNEAGGTMRCRFNLAQPDEGPEGGGMGECQLSDGTQITGATLRGD